MARSKELARFSNELRAVETRIKILRKNAQLLDELRGIETWIKALREDALLALRGAPDPHSWKAAGHRLRVTRLALGLTEQQVAKAYGVSLRTYRGYEAGKRQRDNGGWLRFAEKFDVDLDWIVVGAQARIGKHLRNSKVAILPVITAEERIRRAREEIN
jgi:transcriptional regulator with XRE-family HTH domain